ncbi:flavin reductase family protein [Rhizobium sp. P32RR-XVIII]|uniref:flavin reductase family protein n=1 Tax=Rhizobium sp. P32RR-XVIII TaxID=2726738 RepID=UPI00145654A3|nr:flavin reductase family protein [Rhizobium sp. P32RR-XVIII]NLS05577.1 flavin reductase family protein [Rhizobium sp. P32RR-XVIII]
MPALIASAPGEDHLTITPSVLYFGTPVVLISTLNPDGTANITPMSSAWALGDRVVLGLAASGQGAENLRREGECTLNFPAARHWHRVERIARATGRNPVPDYKARMGYEYAADKFALGGFGSMASELVRPPRISECQMQCEAKVVAVHDEGSVADPVHAAGYLIIEVQVLRVHAHSEIVVPGTNHINTARWTPLFYVFRHYFGLGDDLGKNFRAESI